MLMNPLNDRTQFGRADAEEASRHWWIFLFAGIASIVFGALILTIDWSVDSLGTFVGVLFILQGACAGRHAVARRKRALRRTSAQA